MDFPAILEKKMKIPVSEIAENVEYIRLETKPNSLLGRVLDARITKDFIFIHHNGTPLLTQFDRKGNFIRHIGKVGRGPEEYTLIREFSIDEPNRLIYLQLNWMRKIMVYSFDGKFVKSINLDQDYGKIRWVRDSIFMCFSEPSKGDEQYVFTEINNKGDILQTIKNYNTWKDPAPFGLSMSFHGQNYFYQLNNTLHFKGKYNDTVYTYDKDYKIIPKFYIDLRDYKLPPEMIFERGLVRRIPVKYFWVSVNESSRYVFMLYCAYSTDDPQGDGAPPAGFMFFDKLTGTGNTLMNKEGKMIRFNEIGEWGFDNDFDGGPEFIPEYVNDSLAFHFISSIELKKYLVSDKFNESVPKNPDKKKMLINQLNGIKDNDNDVLMVVKLKQGNQ